MVDLGGLLCLGSLEVLLVQSGGEEKVIGF